MCPLLLAHPTLQVLARIIGILKRRCHMYATLSLVARTLLVVFIVQFLESLGSAYNV
jgi:hypothetical protein